MNIKKVLAFVVAVMMCACVLSACSSKDDVEVDTSSAAETQPESTTDAQITPEFQIQSGYANAEVYTNADGNDAIKTESGEEVEVSGENFVKLYDEYQKIAGTGSDREKELLEQLQIILEKLPNMHEVQE